MRQTCPRGIGALSTVPELINDAYLARQPSVSGPKIDVMIQAMVSGKWSWVDNEIEVNGNVIINGHHRYIASRMAGIEPVFILSEEPYSRTFTWGQINVSQTRW
jgi:hypothetical protein